MTLRESWKKRALPFQAYATFETNVRKSLQIARKGYIIEIRKNERMFD